MFMTLEQFEIKIQFESNDMISVVLGEFGYWGNSYSVIITYIDTTMIGTLANQLKQGLTMFLMNPND